MKTKITKTGLKVLQERLNNKIDMLKTLRDEKAHAYSVSGDGWHDNPGWTQLGQQEEMLASEIGVLQHKIANASIFEKSSIDNKKVQIGCKVEFLIKRNTEDFVCQIVDIVGSGESDIKNNRISYDSPMGKALCSALVDEENEVELPRGRAIIKIKNIINE